MLITFEGIDGSGKSTQIKMLSDTLTKRGIGNTVLTEPGTTVVGEQIRGLLKETRKNGDKLCIETELFLFEAARAQLVNRHIKPMLKANHVVILDRFFDSTWVYQGYVGKINLLTIEFLNRLAIGDVKVNKTFYIDVSVESAIARIKARPKTTPDRFDDAGMEYFTKLKQGYDELVKTFPDRIIKINGDRPADEVFTDVLDNFTRLN